jgi:hypothetical protein
MRKENPLFAVLGAAVGRDEQGKTRIRGKVRLLVMQLLKILRK